MTSKPLVEAALKLTGRFQHEELVQIIQLAPTKTWRVGDSVQSTRLKRENDGWVFSVPQKEARDVGALVSELLVIVDRHKQEIVLAAEQLRLEVTISLGVYMRGETPSCSLDAELVRRISELRANLDIDLILAE